MTQYVATKHDLAMSAALAGDTDDFTIARLMQKVSDEYLAVMAHDHTSDTTKAFKAMVDSELVRRASAEARRANTLAKISIVIAVLSAVASVAVPLLQR